MNFQRSIDHPGYWFCPDLALLASERPRISSNVSCDGPSSTFLSRPHPISLYLLSYSSTAIIESSESSTQELSTASPESLQDQDEDQDGSTSFNVSVANLDDSKSLDPKPTEWNIDNRYYSATVHFLPRQLPKSIAGDSSEHQKKKGAAKRTLAENRALREAAKRKETEKSETKTADVFEALKSTEPNPDVKRLVVESEEIEAFQKEVEGVPAVVLLVKRDDVSILTQTTHDIGIVSHINVRERRADVRL